MPRISTFPTLFDECKTVTISFLKKHGYLMPDQWKTGAITWNRNGHKTGSIGIGTYIFPHKRYLELDYKSDGEHIRYKVALVAVPSNIGKGVVWYFICPKTGKRCRKLYLVGGYFLHRAAFTGCFYEKQTYSESKRNLGQSFEKFFGVDHAYEKIYSKHFKKVYAGKPTKRYRKLLEQIEAGSRISEKELFNY